MVALNGVLMRNRPGFLYSMERVSRLSSSDNR